MQTLARIPAAVAGPDADPATIGGYPPTLPIELALRVAPTREVLEAYDITREQWDTLRYDPVFLQDLTTAVELVKKEGASVKLKARLQCEELLKTSWTMIHDQTGVTPPSVRADLLKHTFRVAGLAEPPQAANAATAATFAIQINLG